VAHGLPGLFDRIPAFRDALGDRVDAIAGRLPGGLGGVADGVHDVVVVETGGPSVVVGGDVAVWFSETVVAFLLAPAMRCSASAGPQFAMLAR